MRSVQRIEEVIRWRQIRESTSKHFLLNILAFYLSTTFVEVAITVDTRLNFCFLQLVKKGNTSIPTCD